MAVEESNEAVVLDEVCWGLIEIRAIKGRRNAFHHDDGTASMRIMMDDGKWFTITVTRS